jgi:hypothetical protein
MKNTLLKNSTTLFSFILIYSFSSLSAQDSYINNRFNLKVGYTRYYNGIFGSDTKDKYERTGNYKVEANYGLLNYFELGAYLSYSKYMHWKLVETDSIHTAYYESEGNNTFFYGANVNFHVLPIFIKKEDFRFDLYVSAKYGWVYFSKSYPRNGPSYTFDYSVGAGLAFYPGKHFGVFMEYCYGRYPYDEKTNLRYGLSLKF